MKILLTRQQTILIIVLAVFAGFALYYGLTNNRKSIKGMHIENVMGSGRSKLLKPDIWLEDFFGNKSKSNTKNIKR
jgi:hypothetical protein